MTKKWKPIAAAAAAALALNSTANAEVEMFLVIDGIQGETTDPEFPGGIDVLAWSWGMSQSGTTHTGGGGGAGTASFQDLSLTHFVDSSSVDLYSAVAMGSSIPTATLSVRKPGITLPYIEIVMHNILVTSASTGGSGGESQLTENVTLNFSKFTTKYTKDDKSPTIEYCFDIAINDEC